LFSCSSLYFPFYLFLFLLLLVSVLTL
jgi:hypothetical protein